MKQLHESRIHCLGRNADQLSDVCRKSVERSVPFICAEEIELYCNSESTLEQGVLQCLEEAFDKEKKPMSVSCQDSMKVTSSSPFNIQLASKRISFSQRILGKCVV